MNSDCVFCDTSQFAERLVATSSGFNVIATLGQITDGGYALVSPQKHISCLGALASGQTNAMLNVAKEVCRALSREYQHGNSSTPYPVTMFEHGIVGQTIKHAHLHLLPTVIDLTAKIRKDFPEAETKELQHAAHLQELYGKRPEPYLFWTVPSGTSMVCWNPPAPSQYLRLIVAELLGRPERGNWRNMNPELDKRLWQETVNRLKPYFS